MSVEQKLTDKNVVTTSTTTTNNTTSSSNSNSNSKPSNNKKNNQSSAKKIIKKALKTSKSKKTNKTTIANVNNNNNTSNNNTDISNKTATNNNNNKSKNTNTEVDCGGNSSNNNNSKSNVEVPNDEIIEELFDFSDSDLKELDATNEENIKDNNSNDFSGEPGEQIEVVEMQKNVINDNNNNKEQQQQEQQQVLDILSNESTDNIDKQINGKEKVNEEENEIKTKTSTANALVESPTTLKLISDSGNETQQQTAEEKKSPKETIDVLNTHCSVEADDKTLPLPSSSPAQPDIKSKQTINESSGPEFVSVNKESNHTATTTDKNNADSSDLMPEDGYGDADDDAGEYVEPYDELLVQFLDEANKIAEARLAARRHARAEAREIRMRELERQQKEQESNADRVFDMHTSSPGITSLSHMRLGLGSSPVTGLLNSTRGNSMSSRRSSEDSLEEEGRSLRDIRHELKDVEDRFRKAMIANAQLDNDRASQTYQIQLLKDKLEDMEESYAQLQRECKEKTRDCNALKRSLDKLSEELKLVQGQLDERDTLITDQGLVIVAIENEDGTDAKRALVSVENAQLLGSVQGSLDVRLKKFSEEKQQLQNEVQHLQEQLETYKSQGKGRGKNSSSNGPLGSDDDDYEAQREANKIISDYKYKLQKAEQEIASLQSSLARSETQVIRYKSTAEAAEKAEAELKIERRKLQRENREAMEKLEELETSNNHLLKRLDKLKNAKSALLKDL